MIELGSTVEDRISRFRGIVVARVERLWGCPSCAVETEDLLHEGKPIEELWFDEGRLKILKVAD